MALAELRRVLRPGGRLVLNMPAYQWLLSAHDRRVHNTRRVTARGLRGWLAAAGFARIRTRYWNTLLLPLMVVQRKLLASGDAAASDVAAFPPSVDAIFHAATVLERWLPFALPAGGSVLAIAERPLDPVPAAPPIMTNPEPAPMPLPLAALQAATGSGSHHAVGLSIVIPVYRGAATIAGLVAELAKLRPEGGMEVVLVNDGSPDNSAEVCRALVRAAPLPLTYIEHARNYGEHNAVMTGLRHARGAYVITMDDDLQNPPEEVVRLYDHARLGGWDVVYTRYAEKKHAPWRNLGSRFANKVADWLLDKPKGLYLSSFRCMSALVVRSVTRYRGPYPYVDGLIMQITQRIDSIEVRHLPRAEGRSNYNLRRLVRLWLNLATSFSLAPLRLAIFAGAGMALLGTVGAVATIAEALLRQDTPSGWASTMTVVLLVAGVQSMILGVLGEYVGRTFLSANGKPQGTVRLVERGGAAARADAVHTDEAA